MARSMTGFGRGQIVLDDRKCSIEIKTINSKYCDVQIRLPRIMNSLENKIRERITKELNRGKVDVYVNYEDNREDSKIVTVDVALVKAYKNALENIAEIIDTREKIHVSDITKQGDVLQVEVLQLNEEDTWRLVSSALDIAIDAVCQMKETEGTSLVTNILEKASSISSERRCILGRAPFVVNEYRSRLQQRIVDLADDLAKKLIDEQRLAMEVAIFADKCAIDEELVRLDSHIQQLKSTLNETEPIGKKLDFILQEMNREINTIGSKANDITITKSVLKMKSDLEKIREQIQNIE